MSFLIDRLLKSAQSAAHQQRDKSGRWSSSGDLEDHSWEASLTERESSYKGLRAYVGSSESTYINAALRAGDDSSDTVKHIDSALSKANLKADVEVYRMIERADPSLKAKFQVGTKYTDKGYTSTTTDRNYADSWGRKSEPDTNIMAIIRMKKGANAAYISKRLSNRKPFESEVLIPRGANFKITKRVDANEHGKFPDGSRARHYETIIEMTLDD